MAHLHSYVFLFLAPCWLRLSRVRVKEALLFVCLVPLPITITEWS